MCFRLDMTWPLCPRTHHSISVQPNWTHQVTYLKEEMMVGGGCIVACLGENKGNWGWVLLEIWQWIQEANENEASLCTILQKGTQQWEKAKWLPCGSGAERWFKIPCSSLIGQDSHSSQTLHLISQGQPPPPMNKLELETALFLQFLAQPWTR